MMASAIERRFDLARAALSAKAEEASSTQEEAQRAKAASLGSLQSGASIKEARAGERALSRKELIGQSDITAAQTKEEQALLSAALQRKLSAGESAAGRQYAAGESAAGRQYAAGESAAGRQYAAGESAAGRQYTAGESAKKREFVSGEEGKKRDYITSEALARRTQAESESTKGRDFAVSEAKSGREFAVAESEKARKETMRQAELNQALAEKGVIISEKEYALNEEISLSNLAQLRATADKDRRRKDRLDIGLPEGKYVPIEDPKDVPKALEEIIKARLGTASDPTNWFKGVPKVKSAGTFDIRSWR
jgi:hypothetical protein